MRALGVRHLQDAVANLLLQDELRILGHLSEHLIEAELAACGAADDAARAQQIDEALKQRAIEELKPLVDNKLAELAKTIDLAGRYPGSASVAGRATDVMVSPTRTSATSFRPVAM